MSATTAHSTDAPGIAAPHGRAGMLGRVAGVGRWVKGHKKLAIAAGGGGLLFVGAIVGALSIALKAPEPEVVHVEPPVTVVEVLAALDRRAFSETRSLCAKMLRINGKNDESLAIIAFARGAVAVYESEEIIDPVKRRRRNLLAIRMLDDARERGFPAKRDAEGLYLLGRSMAFVDRNVAARETLREALKIASPSVAADIARLLAKAYRSEP